MQRGVQPTIRLVVSDCEGISGSKSAERTQALLPAAAPHLSGAFRNCPVESCLTPISVNPVPAGAPIRLPAASRRRAECQRRASRGRSAPTDGRYRAPLIPQRQPAQLPVTKNVIAGPATAPPQLCQEPVSRLFFSLAPPRQRRLNPPDTRELAALD